MMSPRTEDRFTVSSRPSLVRVGGGLGIAACAIGLAVFLAACAGLNAALVMSIVPLALSAPGLVLTIIGGVKQPRQPGVADTHLVASLFINLAGLFGALLLVAVWQGWSIFAGQGG